MLGLLLSEMVITFSKNEPQEAFFFPIIPLLGGLFVAGAVALVLAGSGNSGTDKIVGKSLGILGMPGAGKTQFLRNLQNRPYKKYEQTIGSENYEEFEFERNGRKIKVVEGEDIGGNVENIKFYYEDFLMNKDICFFMFDIKKYIEQERYRNDVNTRLDFINRHINSAKQWAAIGTHVDQAKIEKGKNIIDIVQNHVKDKPYSRLLNTNFFARNLTDKKDMDFIIDKLF